MGFKPVHPRACSIEYAAIDSDKGGGDGAYDLHDVAGTPQEVAKAIGDSLAECDMLGGGDGTYLDRNEDLILTVRIRIHRTA